MLTTQPATPQPLPTPWFILSASGGGERYLLSQLDGRWIVRVFGQGAIREVDERTCLVVTDAVRSIAAVPVAPPQSPSALAGTKYPTPSADLGASTLTRPAMIDGQIYQEQVIDDRGSLLLPIWESLRSVFARCK